MEKLRIDQASVLIEINNDICDMDIEVGHCCTACSYTRTESDAYTFDALPELEESLKHETKMALLYIAGYVSRQHHEDEGDQDATFTYYKKYGSYTDMVSRGKLHIPSDTICQCVIFSYIMFSLVRDRVCRKSLMKIILDISEFYYFGATTVHSRKLANIFINNYCKEVTPRSGKESELKIIKLYEEKIIKLSEE